MFVRHQTNYYFELITIGDWKKEAGLDQHLEGNLISDKQVTRYVIRTPPFNVERNLLGEHDLRQAITGD